MKKLVLLPLFFLVLSFTSCTKNHLAKTQKAGCKGNAVPSCMCTMEYDPVCGCDGKTYGNECGARCEGVKSWTKGKCP